MNEDQTFKVSELATRLYDDGEHLKRWYDRNFYLGPTQPEPAVGGDQLSWRDYKGRTWAGMMGSHNEVDESSEGFQPLLEVPHVGRGDYTNHSIYDRSNMEYLLKHYPDTFITIGYSSHDGQALALPMDAEITEDLWELIEKLDEYGEPLDSDECSQLEQRVIEEDWSSWLESDLRSEVEEALASVNHLDKYVVDMSEYLDNLLTEERDLKTVFWEAMEWTGTYPEFETSESCVIRDMKDVAFRIAVVLCGMVSE